MDWNPRSPVKCQTASNRDPGSASKRDPLPALGQACPGSEQEGPVRVAQCPQQKPASSSRSPSATSNIWRRLFAFSATLEICRDGRICHQERMPNSGRKRDSLITAETSLIARFNSLQGRKKFPVRMSRELARKKLISCAFRCLRRCPQARNRRNSLYIPISPASWFAPRLPPPAASHMRT
jgi:hypothetical protein